MMNSLTHINTECRIAEDGDQYTNQLHKVTCSHCRLTIKKATPYPLVAAAPEMLEMLKALEYLSIQWGSESPELAALIAKAEGEQK